MAIVIDVPAFNVDDDAHSIAGSDNLSTTDTGTELVLSGSSQPLNIHHYGSSGGGGNITLPDTPPGSVLTAATYVVIAFAESDEVLEDPADWSPDTPDPTQAPFLMIETSATSVNFTLDTIPFGSYDGETVWPGNDVSGVLDDIPANRIWLQSYSNIPIHVAYAAVRLTYESLSVISADPGNQRTRFS